MPDERDQRGGQAGSGIGERMQSPVGAYAGPERRQTQADWERWQRQDRRINPFRYP